MNLPGGQGVEDATCQMMTLTQVEAGKMRIPKKYRPQEVISQELEAREIEDAETDCASGENIKSCLVGTFVVSEVQSPAKGNEDCDQLMEAGTRGP